MANLLPHIFSDKPSATTTREMKVLVMVAYLLGSILKTITVSFLETIKLLITNKFSNSHIDNEECKGITLYEGKVKHQRRKPVLHAFEYNVRYALIELDDIPTSFSHTISQHHMSADEARCITCTSGPVYLLTMPTSVGYEQNPLSVYYCYDTEESSIDLKVCIAEVTNTPWAERVVFTFNPNSDKVAKPLHVSPFMDMLGIWDIRTNNPNDYLSLRINVHHPVHGEYFTAELKARRIENFPAAPEAFLWLMPQKVAIWIYWQALKLLWKGVAFIPHPKYATGKRYREEAIKRDSPSQWCNWRDANWPWE